jgi:hypothetical protein
MKPDNKPVFIRGMVITMAVLINAVILYAAFIKNENWYWALMVSAPLLVMVSGRRNKRGRGTIRTHLDKRMH